MSTKEAKQMDQALFDFYGKPSIGQALPLAIQHVLAMIVGCVTPSICKHPVCQLRHNCDSISNPGYYRQKKSRTHQKYGVKSVRQI